MAFKHTPGPWQSVSQGLTHLVSEACDDEFRFAIAKVWEQNYHPDGPRAAHIEAVANARLISAAPDLLAALQEVRIFAEDALNDPSYSREHILSRIFDATAIIHKATGE